MQDLVEKIRSVEGKVATANTQLGEHRTKKDVLEDKRTLQEETQSRTEKMPNSAMIPVSSEMSLMTYLNLHVEPSKCWRWTTWVEYHNA